MSLCLLSQCLWSHGSARVAAEVLDGLGMVEHSEGTVLIVRLIDLKWHSNEFLAEGGGLGGAMGACQGTPAGFSLGLDQLKHGFPLLKVRDATLLIPPYAPGREGSS